jgi:toxin-antitoxin system PIN domain toxin
MKLIDLNLLIYAVNRDAPHHDEARRWWETCLTGSEPIALAWVVILGFLRITTSERVMPQPLTAEEAIQVIDEWLNLPSVKIASPTERHWDIFRTIITSLGTAGNLTTDAHVAALAIEHGATLCSTDIDFARFPMLQWINPLTPGKAS